jgi:inner membrane protein
MIQELIRERETNRNTVVQEVSDKWGRQQTVSGPVIAIPYKVTTTIGEELVEEMKTILVLPDKLEVNGELNPEIRHRGIYKVIVYNSQIAIKGNFHLPDLNAIGIQPGQVQWDQAGILFGISDLRGIQKEISVTLNGIIGNVTPGLQFQGFTKSGFTSNVKLDPAVSDYVLDLLLDLSGSESLYFTPVGKTTNVNLNSTWPSPSFSGNFLPDKSTVDDQGFKASWNILDLNRNFPQVWINNVYSVEESTFGVNLLFPVDEYQKSMRSAKYAFIFIALTFLIYLFVEIINKKRIHPVQYLLVSFALLLFYTLLLSLSEQIGFNLAYVISSAAIIGLITAYSYSIFKTGKPTLVTTLSLIVLYAFLFIILQQEDYALLFGSIGLFLILGFVMYLSKRINWYGQIDEERHP